MWKPDEQPRSFPCSRNTAGGVAAKITAARAAGTACVFGKREVDLGILVISDKSRQAAVGAVAVIVISTAFFSGALAQQPAPAAPAVPKTAAPKPATAKTRAAVGQAPSVAPTPQTMNPGPAPDMPQLIYSPWAKYCSKGKDAQAKQFCFTGKDARTEAGQPLVGVVLIEPEGEPRKLFRITLPNPLQLQYGTRLIVDQQPPLTAPYFTCVAGGCMADYEATPDLIGKLKHGQTLTIQAISLAGAAVSFPLPLVDFANANEGPASDPKVVEAQRPQQPAQEKKLEQELQKRADEALKKFESQNGAPIAPTR
jgi:invasion protein IalB